MSFPVNRRGFNEAKRVSIRSCPSPIMHIHEIIRPSVEADLSALSGFSNIRIIVLKVIIGPFSAITHKDGES
jgi:hypothetical protein